MLKLLLIIGMCLIWAFSGISWGTNIYKFAKSDFETPHKTEILRGVGILFAPIGVIIGFMDIGEENK